ncbi:MAG: hypothetical protein KZQ92_05090 [Candidatus Thiodiazotropha sp. (ex Lucinoma borealis)]|nr:hypothetical protein [Candidatus Thiodiazotropha sp. (ex Lucinoma borealis)]MCU7863335.1 hypothetical protein [Candidatus Thiodiazotropha sp. (ex Lucinoma borealis)]MCU7870899.1 hypothetical protein [Candidatus Thiodiazotropha sp. (ex Lucinoma borealis)]
MPVTSISRRIEKSIEALTTKDYESAFVQLFPAIDKTAKKRRPREGVGARIKGFISDEEAVITAVAVNGVIIGNTFDGVDFPTALYKFGRTSIVHEGELDKKLQINEHGDVIYGKVWNLPSSYIDGLIIAVVLAPENSGEKINDDIDITLFDKQYQVNQLWGRSDLIRAIMFKLFPSYGNRVNRDLVR